MTYREALKKIYPECVSHSWLGGCLGCPGGAFTGARCVNEPDCNMDCEACWDQEMPGTKPEKRHHKQDKSKKVVYIAGKITGNPDYKRYFNQAENELLVKGYKPLNPAHLPSWLPNAKAMRICLSMIDEADAVLFLPGWRASSGANLEHEYCKYTGKTIYYGLEEVSEQ